MMIRGLLLLLQVHQVLAQCDATGDDLECDIDVPASDFGPNLLQLQSQIESPSDRSSSSRRLLLSARGGGNSKQGSAVAVPLTFKHFAKTGGTFVEGVLAKVIPEELLTIVNETQYLQPETTEGHFVMGGIRNPCEYYPSLWAHQMSEYCHWGQDCYMHAFPAEERSGLLPDHRQPPYDSPEDLRRFRAFLRNTSSVSGDLNLMSMRFWGGYVRRRGEEGGQAHEHAVEHSTARQYLDIEMSPEERQEVIDSLAAYDPNHSAVSCWMKVESLDDDLRQCLQLYAQQGGKVLWGRLDEAMGSSTHYTSSHSACSVYYDAETRAAVRRGDAAIFEKFGYTSCCEEGAQLP